MVIFTENEDSLKFINANNKVLEMNKIEIK